MVNVDFPKNKSRPVEFTPLSISFLRKRVTDIVSLMSEDELHVIINEYGYLWIEELKKKVNNG